MLLEVGEHVGWDRALHLELCLVDDLIVIVYSANYYAVVVQTLLRAHGAGGG